MVFAQQNLELDDPYLQYSTAIAESPESKSLGYAVDVAISDSPFLVVQGDMTSEILFTASEDV
ncbi:MAG: hypothetical protein H6765_04130 [Candidatus Peribacteria bacterium]|nr:MAG: hypothetical protein H6765_04130 [Candidatus Peribacteria bacterium]